MLANPIYVGEIRHKRVSYPGHHEPIIERAQWRRVQEMLKHRATRQGGDTSRRTPSFLMGKVFDENGEPLYACWSKKGNRRYRYFVSRKLVRGADKTRDGGWRISAEEIERAAMAVVAADAAITTHTTSTESASRGNHDRRALLANTERLEGDNHARDKAQSA
jgi:site-specific DNA recombinase